LAHGRRGARPRWRAARGAERLCAPNAPLCACRSALLRAMLRLARAQGAVASPRAPLLFDASFGDVPILHLVARHDAPAASCAESPSRRVALAARLMRASPRSTWCEGVPFQLLLPWNEGGEERFHVHMHRKELYIDSAGAHSAHRLGVDAPRISATWAFSGVVRYSAEAIDAFAAAAAAWARVRSRASLDAFSGLGAQFGKLEAISELDGDEPMKDPEDEETGTEWFHLGHCVVDAAPLGYARGECSEMIAVALVEYTVH
jgi:hypothetical protein